jgi:triosephosphate isomerase (TIM)
LTARPGRPLLVGNWKMNLGEGAARELAATLARTLPFDRVDAAVAPPFPFLRAVLDAAAGTPLAVGAQNVHAEERGAFTGEVAAPMLAGMGVRFVIVGHSERRALFGETDAIVARKLASALRHGLRPILCVGETEAQRDQGRMRDVVVAQLNGSLAAVDASAADALVVAYEPVWAIGTGRTPDPADVIDAHRAIREALRVRFGVPADEMRILYGGSATPANAARLLLSADVGGALVGGASLDAGTFEAIAAIAAIAAAGA